jgi:ABC-type multidrug transport system fused ATPase/permease subunit
MSTSTSSRPPRSRSGRPGRGGRSGANDGPRAKFSQLLPYLSEHKPVLGVVIGLSILAAGASLLQPLLVSQVIARVQAGDTLDNLVWALVALVVVSGLLGGFQHYLLQRTGTSVVLSARRQLVRRMLRLPISEFDTRRTGDLVSRVGSDTTLLYAVITQGLVDAVGGAILFVGALIAMLILDPVLLGLTVLVIAISAVAVVALSGRIRTASRLQQERVGDLASSVERVISAIRTVRASNATDREIAVVEKNAEAAWEMGVRVAKVSSLVVPIANIALQVSLLVVLGVGGFRVAAGALTIADLIAFILFLFMMIMPLGALGRIQEIIALPSEAQNDKNIVAVAAIESDDAVTFENVVFTYPDTAKKSEAEKVLAEAGLPLTTVTSDVAPSASGAVLDTDDEAAAASSIHDRTVLHGISFSAARGKRTALVGPSGAGKSTILALIERFYDPTDGVVRLGGVDIRGLDRDELRAQIGYVEQDAPVLAGTIRENLTLGAPNATDAQCIEVLHAVNLTEVLERNEAGLNAAVGEDGVMLSGGERQRLAIARTLLAAPPILLLDESTSSLDGVNEQMMREAIDAVAQDRTLIVIAHRLSTVVDSDQIVVLDHGNVVGVGTHSELVLSTPLYKDLAKHQLLV